MKKTILTSLKCFALGLLVFLCVCWVLYFQNLGSTCWVEMTAFYGLTIWLLKSKNIIEKLSNNVIVFANIIGGILPIVLVMFAGNAPAAPLCVGAIAIGSLLGWICKVKNNWVFYLISFVIAVAYNSIFIELLEKHN